MSGSLNQLRPSMMRMAAWLAPIMAVWMAGCGGTDRETTPEQSPGAKTATTLRIAAASDLQNALPELGERFREKTGIGITPTFTSSGVLTKQIEQGAPYDVFLSANEAFVHELARKGAIVKASVHSYATGSLVLAVYRDLGDTVQSLADLEKPEVKKIALANPETAPYGRAGKQALERAGLWEKLQPKIVIAESVRQALMYAQTGDAEAALIGRAIADVPEIRAIDIDAELYDPIVQALGVVAESTHRDDAEAFARFVLGDEGQAILKAFGFRPGASDAKDRPSGGSNDATRREDHRSNGRGEPSGSAPSPVGWVERRYAA